MSNTRTLVRETLKAVHSYRRDGKLTEDTVVALELAARAVERATRGAPNRPPPAAPAVERTITIVPDPAAATYRREAADAIARLEAARTLAGAARVLVRRLWAPFQRSRVERVCELLGVAADD